MLDPINIHIHHWIIKTYQAIHQPPHYYTNQQPDPDITEINYNLHYHHPKHTTPHTITIYYQNDRTTITHTKQTPHHNIHHELHNNPTLLIADPNYFTKLQTTINNLCQQHTPH